LYTFFLTNFSTLGPNAQVSDCINSLRRANERIARNLQLLSERPENDQIRQRINDDRNEARGLCRTALALLQNPTPGLDLQRFLPEFQNELKTFETNSNQFKALEQKSASSAAAAAAAASAASAAAAASASATTSRPSESRGKKKKPSKSRDVVVDMGRGSSDGGVDIGAMMGVSETEPMLDELQQETSEKLVMYEAEELRRREQEILELEADVALIHEWVIKFNQLVHEQGEQLERIEDVLVQAKEQTKQAHQELESAEDYQKRSRKTKCCLLSIFVIVAAVVAIGVWQSIS